MLWPLLWCTASVSQYKMVAVELDHTLLRPDRSISVPTKEYLRRLAQLGVTIAIVTRRSKSLVVQHLADLNLGVAVPVVAYNGAEGVVMYAYGAGKERLLFNQVKCPSHFCPYSFLVSHPHTCHADTRISPLYRHRVLLLNLATRRCRSKSHAR